MAQTDRKYTGHVTLFTVGGVSVLGTFKNATLRLSNDMQEARAAKDAWRARVPRISQWDIDLSKCVELDGYTFVALVNTLVTVAFISDATDGFSLSGDAWLRELTANFPDADGQEQQLSLEGYGQPAIVAT